MRLLFTCVLLCGLLAGHAGADTYMVAADGTGEYPTIQSAIEATADGDTVSLGPGIYLGDGNRDISFQGKAITLRSNSGNPDDCIIDCEGSAEFPRRGIRFPSSEGIGPDTIVEGITITNGYGGDGGGVWGQDASPTLIRCVLAGNTATQNGGGLSIESSDNAYPTLMDCVIRDNYAGFRAGGCFFQEVSPVLERCVLANNEGEQYGGGMVYAYGDGGLVLSQCTFVGNTGSEGACLYLNTGATAVLENCILAAGVSGEALYCSSNASAQVSCTDVWGNEGGDWIGCIADQASLDGNLNTDPLFCGAQNPESPYSLSAGSPCAPQSQPDCGLIGALPVGCGQTGITDDLELPRQAVLERIFPNPFNPQTTISFSLQRGGWAEVAIYSLTGRRVLVLADRTFASGTHALGWDGRDADGRFLPSGAYIVRLEAESLVEARIVSLIR